jgi:glutaredoxin
MTNKYNMYYDIECPYCEKQQEIDHDDGYGYDEDQAHKQTCD